MKYFKPNTKLAIKIAIYIKGLTATLATMAFVMGKPTLLFTIMVVGAVANETINFLSDDTKNNNNDIKPDSSN